MVNPQKPETVTIKSIALAQRKIDIALMRCMDKEGILSHDLFDDSNLFDLLTTSKIDKLLILADIKKGLLSTKAETEFKKDPILSTLKKDDFMSYVRQHGGFFTSKTFSAAIKSVLESVERDTENKAINILFDSYLEISIKRCKLERQKGQNEGIELATTYEFVTIPAQTVKF